MARNFPHLPGCSACKSKGTLQKEADGQPGNVDVTGSHYPSALHDDLRIPDTAAPDAIKRQGPRSIHNFFDRPPDIPAHAGEISTILGRHDHKK